MTSSPAPIHYGVARKGQLWEAVGSWERLLTGVPQGRRNDSLARLVGKMLAEGTPAEFARMAAHEFGRRCNPPMDPNELERTFESILSRERRKTGRRPALINLADVEAEEVEYLWSPYLPLRKVGHQPLYILPVVAEGQGR